MQRDANLRARVERHLRAHDVRSLGSDSQRAAAVAVAITDGVVVPEPAQFTAMPTSVAQRASIWPTG